jgi:hypothetical protein
MDTRFAIAARHFQLATVSYVLSNGLEQCVPGRLTARSAIDNEVNVLAESSREPKSFGQACPTFEDDVV